MGRTIEPSSCGNPRFITIMLRSDMTGSGIAIGRSARLSFLCHRAVAVLENPLRARC